MIAGGVSFQPGAPDDRNRINPNAPNGTQEGVQEAIKVLSLRLPKVVGAQAIAPTPLLTSPGSGGNNRADSMVAQVMQKFFPTEAPPSGAAPSLPSEPSAPPAQEQPPFQGLRQRDIGQDRPWRNIPNIITGGPPPEANFIGPPQGGGKPNMPTWDGGWSPLPTNMTEPLPNLRSQLDWVPPRDESPLI